MRSARSLLLIFGSVVLLSSACGSSANTSNAPEETEPSEVSEPTNTTAASTTSEATTTSAEGPTTVVTSETVFPATPAVAFLLQTYLFGSEQGTPTAEQLPVLADSITAHWFLSDGFYVVVYGGLDPSLSLCPGNSIQTTSGFENVSNAPLNDADCSFAPVVAEAPNGVVTCNGIVSYVTLIPAGSEGVLFGSIEIMTDGLGVGLTSQTSADPANIPEIQRELIDC